MKKEDKELVCDHIEKFRDYLSSEHCYVVSQGCVDKFKRDNDLIEKNVTGWYVNDNSPMWIGYFDYENRNLYGIDSCGNWMNHSGFWKQSKGDFLASNEEVFERLSRFAREKGYDKKQSECLDDIRNDIDFNGCYFSLEFNSLWINSKNGFKINCIMKGGKWAGFIEEEKPVLTSEIFLKIHLDPIDYATLGDSPITIEIKDVDFKEYIKNKLKLQTKNK